MPDESILSWRRLLVAGVAFGLLLALLAGGVIAGQPAPVAPRALEKLPLPAPLPALHVGDRVYATSADVARDASSAEAGAVCRLDPTQIGVIVEIGGSLAGARDWAEVRFGGCQGWVILHSLRPAVK